MARRDFYEVLGVPRDVDAADLKRAYRELAMRHHPDKNPGEKASEERFKELSEAYAVLSDPEQRARYDRLGHLDGGGFEAAVGSFTDLFEGLFGDLFGRKKRERTTGRDLRYTLEIEFVEAMLGCEKVITIPSRVDCEGCAGTGARGGEAGRKACTACGGRGEIKVQQGFFSVGKRCSGCAGEGTLIIDRCPTCRGVGTVEKERDYTVVLPPGVEDGNLRRVPSQGEPGRHGAAAGDLHVIVKVKPHPLWRREGMLLSCDVPITFAQAALGAAIEVPTLDGKVEMKIPPGTQTGTVFRLRGKGVAANGARGDAHVRLVVETPIELTDEQRDLIARFSAATSEASLPLRRAFFDRQKPPE